MVGDLNDKVKDVNDDPPQTSFRVEFFQLRFTRTVWELNDFPVFIFIYLAGGIPKIPHSRRGAGSGTSKLSPAPSASPLSSTPIRMLVLLALCTTRRGGLKLLSGPNTRITPFRPLADKERKTRSEERKEGSALDLGLV
jgi:hypothetical protein